MKINSPHRVAPEFYTDDFFACPRYISKTFSSHRRTSLDHPRYDSQKMKYYMYYITTVYEMIYWSDSMDLQKKRHEVTKEKIRFITFI